MSEKSAASTRVAFPLSTGLFLLFVGLKLGQVGVVANWSWLAVTSPLWVPIAAYLGLLLAVGFGMALVAVLGVFISWIDKDSKRKGGWGQ